MKAKDDNDRLRGGELPYDPFVGAVPVTTLSSIRNGTSSTSEHVGMDSVHGALPAERQQVHGVLISEASERPEQGWDPPLPLDGHGALPPFPVHVFPNWLRDQVASVAQATQTPVDLAGMIALSVLALAVAKKLALRVRPGWVEPLCLWVVVALAPANRKSVVFSALTRPVRDHERDEEERLRPRAEAAQVARKIAEGRAAEAAARAQKARPEEVRGFEEEAQRLAAEARSVQVPVAPRLFVDDVTPERLAQLMADHGGRLAIMSDEGGIFSILSGRYNAKSSQQNFDVFLKSHSGDAMRVDRISRGPTTLDRPSLTMGLAVQPDVLLGLAQQRAMRGRGLLARFLFSIPTSLLGRREANPPPVPHVVEARYTRCVRALLEQITAGSDARGELSPATLELSPDAHAVIVDFQREVEPLLSPGKALHSVGDWAGKLPGAVARVAGLLHAADSAESLSSGLAHPLPAATVRRAVEVGRYLIPHALAAFDAIGADARWADAQAVVDWLRVEGRTTVTRRDVQQAQRSRFPQVERVDPVLAILVEHGYLRAAPPGPPRRGRPPSPTFLVSPFLLGPSNPRSETHNSARP